MRGLGPTLLLLSLLPSAGTPAVAADGAAPTFERDIRPILAARCVVCHNARELANPDTSAGLALDTFDAAIRGTDKHKVVVPGKPDESGLFTRLGEADEERRMPLSDAPLPPAKRDLIRRWIEAGALRGEPVAVADASKTARKTVRRARSALDVVAGLPALPPRDKAAELRLKIGPLPPVSALAFGGDGTTLAVGTNGRVTIWDLDRREVVRALDEIPGPVLALAFSPDGKALAVGAGLPARSGVARVYRVADGTILHALEGHADSVAGLAFRPDGGGLATASYDATVRLWDLPSGKPAGTFKGHSDFVHDVAFLPDGKSLLSASKDRTIKRLDAATASEIRSYGEHDDDVLAIAVRPDGSGFVSAGNEPQIRSWAIDGEKSSRKVGAHTGPVHQLAYSRDGKRLVSAGGDRTIRVFDGATGAHLKSLPGPTEWQYAVAVRPDGRRVAGGGWDGVVRVWDADAPRLELILLQPPGRSPGEPSWLSVAADGTLGGTPDLREAVRWAVDGQESRELARPPVDLIGPPAPAARPK